MICAKKMFTGFRVNPQKFNLGSINIKIHHGYSDTVIKYYVIIGLIFKSITDILLIFCLATYSKLYPKALIKRLSFVFVSCGTIFIYHKFISYFKCLNCTTPLLPPHGLPLATDDTINSSMWTF